MTKNYFHGQQIQTQIAWRKFKISSIKNGYHNGIPYEHIIPRTLWKETLWQGIRNDLPAYLSSEKIQAHTGTHNLLSSWILCANLYFIVRTNPGFKQLMLGFLKKHISAKIIGITNTELEFALDGELSPGKLLGEYGGNRDSGQTSPDVALIVETDSGKGIILTECKYTEYSFYRCSARTTKDSKNRKANPDPQRCIHDAKGYNYKTICHQTVWQRKYWDNLTLSEYGEDTLKRCPASTAGYQLFRQHALAEGIAETGKYSLVVSSVAFDEGNRTLIDCMKTTGIPDFTAGWGKLFTGKTHFKTWTHKQWVEYVRQSGKEPLQIEWVNYMNNRYGY